MYKLVLILSLTCLPVAAFCQRVTPVSVDQLQARLSNGGDTTFVINFWATWCAPCIKELPAFEALDAYHSQKVKVLLVSVDFISQLQSSVMPFVQRKHLQSEVLLLHEKNQQMYIDRIDKTWSGAIPATLMIRENKREFFEKTFTTETLLTTFKNFAP